jgi:N-acyl-D-aspartate/D-glutamate deacylase
MASYDIHIKGGIVVDGTRAPQRRADVWIKDGKIAQVGGRALGSATRVIDADDLIVAPGFVDLHTHYDAQIRWDPYCTISGWHGVTSVVLGNCGFGFAPVRPDFRERSMLTMTRNEAIPYECMKQGMKWDWETIPQYLDSLERAPKGVNVIQCMPTASLMIYVMGLDAAKSRPANEKERAEMASLLNEGMEAGLSGFSIQRLGPNSAQADFDGSSMVTDTMVDEDILNLARVLRKRNQGFVQITQDTGRIKPDHRFVETLAATAMRPILYNVISATRDNPEPHRKSIRWLEKARASGLPIWGQTGIQRSGFAFTLEHWNLYDYSPAWRVVTTGTLAQRLQKMKEPKLREAIKLEAERSDPYWKALQAVFGGAPQRLLVQWVNNHSELEKYVGKVIQQIANEEGKHWVDVMLDIACATNLKAEFLSPDRGMNASFISELFTSSEHTLPGVSDGGAHTKFFTGGAFTTDFLRWLVRDERKITLEEAHYRLSSLTARAAGLINRGELRENQAADIVVYSLEDLDVRPHWVGEIAYDLPGGEWRRVQHALGYRAILVNGQVTFEDGKPTGALSGAVLRNGLSY